MAPIQLRNVFTLRALLPHETNISTSAPPTLHTSLAAATVLTSASSSSSTLSGINKLRAFEAESPLAAGGVLSWIAHSSAGAVAPLLPQNYSLVTVPSLQPPPPHRTHHIHGLTDIAGVVCNEITGPGSGLGTAGDTKYVIGIGIFLALLLLMDVIDGWNALKKHFLSQAAILYPPEENTGRTGEPVQSLTAGDEPTDAPSAAAAKPVVSAAVTTEKAEEGEAGAASAADAAEAAPASGEPTEIDLRGWIIVGLTVVPAFVGDLCSRCSRPSSPARAELRHVPHVMIGLIFAMHPIGSMITGACAPLPSSRSSPLSSASRAEGDALVLTHDVPPLHLSLAGFVIPWVMRQPWADTYTFLRRSTACNALCVCAVGMAGLIAPKIDGSTAAPFAAVVMLFRLGQGVCVTCDGGVQ